jgi:hypothetical protein
MSSPVSLFGRPTTPIPEIGGDLQWLKEQTQLKLEAVCKFKGTKTLEELLKDQTLPILTDLNLYCFGEPGLDYERDLLPLLGKSPELTSLNLGYWEYLTDENVREIIGKCNQEKLETLNFYTCRNLTADLALFLLNSCPNLKRVIFLGCPQINQDKLREKCQTHPKYRQDLFEANMAGNPRQRGLAMSDGVMRV